MKLYLVVSESLWDIVPILDDGTGPKEYYRIAELVVARNAAQARYLAWSADSSFTKDIRDMPKFRCVAKLPDALGPARIATTEYEGRDDADLWDCGGKVP